MEPGTRIEAWGLQLIDGLFARLPGVRPPARRLQSAKIIAHRGIHDNRQIMENTLAAFEGATSAGIWGVELDLRWTRDGEAVVCHDPDLVRVFGIPAAVHSLTYTELRRRCPQVPRLAEVVDRFGKRLHLMIELKQAPGTAGQYPLHRLAEYLSPLRPVHDYHLMALIPALLESVDWNPAACLPIARLGVDAFSQLAMEKGYGGLCGHYALLRRCHLRRHHRRGQRIGTGFIASRASLYRELNRGVAWLFSNHAAEMQKLCEEG